MLIYPKQKREDAAVCSSAIGLNVNYGIGQ
jgi:hypothetical protein